MRAITDAAAGRARLLSFDGGGIRGLFAHQSAKRIETLLREKNASTGSPWPPCNNPAAKYNNPASPGNNLERMNFLCEAGAAHAEQVVKLSHFDDE